MSHFDRTRHTPRRILVLATCLAALVVIGSTAGAQQPPRAQADAAASAAPEQWIDSWGASFLSTTVNGVVQAAPALNNQTYRLNVFSKLGGTQVRVKLSNKFATNALGVGAAHVALRSTANSIVATSDNALTFGGSPGVTLAPGAEIWSDPVALTIAQHVTVAVSVYVPGSFRATTFHPTGLHTSYLSSTGNFTGSTTLPLAATGGNTTTQVLMVSGLQVWAPSTSRVAVAFGDSITDGACATNDANRTWPDVLSNRVPTLPSGAPFSVINMGIGSNRLVASDLAGPSGVHRFADDVLARPNVGYVILLEGINDISYHQATASTITDAYATFVTQAHAAGIKVYGATLLPIGNSSKYTAANEATRQAVNTWIRIPGHFDAVLDFEAVVKDPTASPLRIKSTLTCDYVHPNAAGYAALGNAIPASLFNSEGSATGSTVPNVVNLTQATATTAINNAGLVVGTVGTAASATVAPGSVISQNPSAGASVASGSPVSLVVSTGVTVPSVVGQTQAAATAALTTAGFLVTTSTQTSASVPSGSVISQNPAGGAGAPGGSTVALVISSGAPSNITLANAQSARGTSQLSSIDLSYTVPNLAGQSLLLVVYGGAECSTANLALPTGATFHGVAMNVAAQHDTPGTGFSAGAGMYWHAVAPNESGTIRLSFTGTCDERAVGAVTLAGAALTGPEAVETATGTGNLSDQILTKSPNALVISTATQGNSDALTATGTGHVLDTSAGLNSSRVVGGHAGAATPATRTLGFTGNINRIAMILASFPVAAAP